MADGCIAETESGSRCGRPAPLLDLERQGMVCLDHASYLSADQRRLIGDVLRALSRALESGRMLSAAARQRQPSDSLDERRQIE